MKKQQKMNVAEQSIAYTLEQSTNRRHSGEGRSRKINASNPVIDSLDIWSSVIVKKSATGRGSKSKISSYGIQKLRELILELAVRGKLVPQEPGDEPAGELLKKIDAGKSQLIKDGKIKKRKPLPLIEQEEVPFALPSNWEWSRLGSVCTKVTDGSHNPPPDAGSGYPMLSSQNVNYGRIDFSSPSRFVTEEGFLSEDQRTSIKPNDVLLNIVASIGRSAVVPSDAPKFVLQRSVAVLCSELNPYFLTKMLVSPLCLTYYDAHAKGTAQKGIYLGKLSLMPLAIPPLVEQARIVAKVDELMALCDQLEQQQTDSLTAHQTLVETLLNALVRPESDEEGAPAATNFEQAWQRIAEHFDTLFTTEHSIDQLKQTILQLAVMGRLVPQNPDDEPASVLLEKIAKEKARLIKEGKIKKQKALPQITKEQKPYNLPDGWLWIRLPDIGELARGKSKHRPRNDPKLYIGGATPMVQTGDVARADSIVSTYTALYNQKGVAQSRLWPRGTMCITIAANIADTGILGFEACFPDSIVGFIPFDKKINVKYFEYFIRTAKEHLEDFAPSTAQKNINLEILSKLLVPMPPANELIHIVSKVEELMTICDVLKTRLQEAQITQVHLADAIVKQAV